ncbi:MAG: isochorismatase family protein [Luteolibacter sp.]
MALSLLDPRTALVVIDLQLGLAGYPTVHPLSSVIEKAAELAAAFRRHELPVVLVTVNGGAPGRAEQSRVPASRPEGWDQLVPELDAQPSDLRVSKSTWGAFASSDLEQRLRDLGVTQIVLAGVATSIGVESTARQAFEAGFNVTLATDAMTDVSLEAHENSLLRIFPRLGETGSSRDILALLDSRPR